MPNPLPTVICALDPALLDRALALIEQAGCCEPVDVPTLEVANKVFCEIDQLAKDIAAKRMELTRPLDALKRQIIEVERQATDPLAAARQNLGRRVVACQREMERRREEEAAKARAEAERKAAEIRAAQEAERKAAEELREQEAALFGVASTPEPEQRPDPIVDLLPPAPPPAPKAAAMVAKRQTAEVYDPAALIAEACKDGGRIHGRLVVVVDEAAVLALLKAGCPVPGARLIEVESLRANGRRG
jgi:hypothetical protein